jgi:nicotinate-nucleotide adenylyltransferase
METDRSGNRVRIGLFGGTFDPIHFGHLRAAEEAREAFGLERVLFIPSARPPHKDPKEVSPAHHRLEMTRRAVRGNPVFHVSDVECRRSDLSYSVETLRILRSEEALNGVFYFILGIDAFLELETWRDYEQLFALSHLVVLERSGIPIKGRGALPARIRAEFRYDRIRRAFEHPSGGLVYFRRFRSLEISGREIRRRVRLGRSIRYLVPDEVEDYIRLHRLYR